MTYEEALSACRALLPRIRRLYGLEGWDIRPIGQHRGGRNLAFLCARGGGEERVLRVSYLEDRAFESYLAEAEYVRYLAKGGAGVADALPSRNGNLAEPIEMDGHVLPTCLFERARGISLADNQYRYRPGAPLSEYFFNCGEAIGRIHSLSKRYSPAHRRPDFFERFCEANLVRWLPEPYAPLREKLIQLLSQLRALERSPDAYGMVHFDFSDGNYHIDFDTGAITAFDFDNSCFCWYLYDLANLWAHGVGWVQFEPDADKRRAFMDEYFREVIRGYRTSAEISDAALEDMPLMLNAVSMEGIVDEFECMRRVGDTECDPELMYRIRCMVEDIPYMGFYDSRYSVAAPFCLLT